jgi:nitrilase
VDLIVLPELCTLHYSREVFQSLDDLAEPLNGLSVERFAELARRTGAMVVFGMARRTKSGFRISQVILSATGELAGYYDKMHLCQYGASCEKEFFERGEKIITVDIKNWTVAPLICYDIRIPEMSRALVLEHDADLLLHCGAYFRDESFSTWHSFAITRAMENQAYLLSLNRAGKNFGNSLFCPPWMDEAHPADHFAEYAEEFRVLELDPDLPAKTRSVYTFLKDRHAQYRL